MAYLALQTMTLLAATAGVFFALGYAFSRRFTRPRIVVSDQPPASPPPKARQNDEADTIIRDLRSRLLEKERDLSQLLDNVPHAKSEIDAEKKRLQELEKDFLSMQLAHDAELDRRRELEKRCQTLEANLQEAQEEARDLERKLQELASRPQAPLVDPKLQEQIDSLTAEVELKNDRLADFQKEVERLEGELKQSASKIETLDAQLYEREYLLQVTRKKEETERDDLARAADAIWGDEEIQIGPSETEALLLEKLQQQNEKMEKEFRDKMRALEASMENLRNENEMALMAAMEISKPAPAAPPSTQERDSLVEMLWRQEKDAEKERLLQSVDSLKGVIDEKEKALEELGQQLRVIADKLPPELTGPDNLQLIKGIGPYIRKMLEREFQIKTFAQLATMTSSEAQRISKKLFFKDKIEKDDWINQARELHLRKYGEVLEVVDPPYEVKPLAYRRPG